ncbi:hypothetical protein EV193_1011020 [Herbihabitans rhizosphaerae]|uniref:Uncharacterized protein n=2 Tax=Herbihabitans rhizosphaerae TaxID=1872711 RepID=A0A4V2EUM9_9PSEU|nr:hypothetical protein EV193_1011020 [Herbihabitans rhizosphaerae]
MERTRESVREQFPEPVSVYYFRKKFLVFDDHGVVLTGVWYHNRFLRIVGYIGVPIYLLACLVIMLPYLVVRGLIDEFRSSSDAPRRSGKGGGCTVSSGANADAVALHRAVRAGGRDQWLVVSPSGFAVVVVKRDAPRVLWRADDSRPPRFDAGRVEVSWPGGSAVRFELSEAERMRGQRS